MTVALKVDCSAGSATLTTVLSMKAMLVPRIAAARIHGPDCGRHGRSAVAERIAASSQGAFMRVLMRERGGRFGDLACVRGAGEMPFRETPAIAGGRRRNPERIRSASL